ncbi:unnamed protein product, partial [Phaeothamnion confervicola]
ILDALQAHREAISYGLVASYAGLSSITLALDQLFELAHVSGNLETLRASSSLAQLLPLVCDCIAQPAVPAVAFPACRAVWRLASVPDMQHHLVTGHAHARLFALLAFAVDETT